jgi:epoxide hydrolase-like predicted phosphatase
MIKAVIFDLWGTLALPYEQKGKSNPVMELLNKIGIERYEYQTTRPFAYATMTKRRSVEESMRDLLNSMGISATEELVEDISSIMKRIDSNDGVLYDDVIPTLKDLRKRSVKTAILSNAFYVEDLHKKGYLPKKWEMESYIDYPIFSFDTGLLKPDPAAYLAALERIGVKAEEAIFIDDFPLNVDAAKELSIKGLLIDRRDNHNYVDKINTLKEVIKFL